MPVLLILLLLIPLHAHARCEVFKRQADAVGGNNFTIVSGKKTSLEVIELPAITGEQRRAAALLLNEMPTPTPNLVFRMQWFLEKIQLIASAYASNYIYLQDAYLGGRV